VSDQSDAEVAFYFLPERPMSSSGDRGFADTWRQGGPKEVRQVQSITLNDLLPQLKMEHIDFLSMDIELSEPKALAGFDLNRYRPRLVCVEAHPAIRQMLLDYFSARSYRVLGKYLRVDVNNLWFTPTS
jgi:hypothetical protein